MKLNGKIMSKNQDAKKFVKEESPETPKEKNRQKGQKAGENASALVCAGGHGRFVHHPQNFQMDGSMQA